MNPILILVVIVGIWLLFPRRKGLSGGLKRTPKWKITFSRSGWTERTSENQKCRRQSGCRILTFVRIDKGVRCGGVSFCHFVVLALATEQQSVRMTEWQGTMVAKR